MMKTMSAQDAKNANGMILDTASAEPLSIKKHGRDVVVVDAAEEYERLKPFGQIETGIASARARTLKQ